MTNNSFFKIKAPEVISEVIDGEAVIVNLDTGAYYSIQGSGGMVWKLIEAGASPTDMLEQLVNRYGSNSNDIFPSLLSFLNELRGEGLIEFTSPLENLFPKGLSPQDISGNRSELFEKPVLAKYTDMADLLLLDPIHEVDETGWPEPKTPKQE